MRVECRHGQSYHGDLMPELVDKWTPREACFCSLWTFHSVYILSLSTDRWSLNVFSCFWLIENSASRATWCLWARARNFVRPVFIRLPGPFIRMNIHSSCINIICCRHIIKYNSKLNKETNLGILEVLWSCEYEILCSPGNSIDQRGQSLAKLVSLCSTEEKIH